MSVTLPNGSFAINTTEMAEINLKITPDEGYYIHSIMINEDELRVVEPSETFLTLPALEHSSQINVVFVSTTQNSIHNATENTIHPHITVTGKTIHVEGLSQGESVKVYNHTGILLKDTIDDTFTLENRGIYILRAGEKSFKISI